MGFGFMTLRSVALACAVAAALAGCARQNDSHGYVPDEAAIELVSIGVDTKETVALVLGRPSTQGIIDDSGWYYVRSDYEQYLWRAPVEINREVLAVTFDEAQVVQNIERFGLEDGQVVVLSRRVTDTNTQGVGFLRQLFGNLGNVNPGQFFDGN